MGKGPREKNIFRSDVGTPRASPVETLNPPLSLCPAVLYGDDRLLRLEQITSEHERRAFTYENARKAK